MTTDSAQIRAVLRWTPERIAAVKSKTTWSDRVDALLDLLQPIAITTRIPWWLELTHEAAMASVSAKQDRIGPETFPFGATPAGKSQVEIKLDFDEGLGIPDNGQTVLLAYEAQYFQDGPFEPAGATTLKHGDNMSHGADVGYKGTFDLDPGRYPINDRVRVDFSGMLNCGIQKNFVG